MKTLKRTDLINALIKANRYKSYLEIGYGTGINFRGIKCKTKISVDPNHKEATKVMTSDVFFEKNLRKFDLIFVDGLHFREQVNKDVISSLIVLNKGGLILIHDCLPTREEEPSYEKNNWRGHVWKAIVDLARMGYLMDLIEIETGIVVIDGTEKTYDIPPGELNWEWYKNNYKKLFK